EDGTFDSMVQRVVRQAQEANLTTDITLATNASQLDIITNQLGDSVIAAEWMYHPYHFEMYQS
ncbi:hypothetical protein, partial [Salmonella enterica]|uniref:hypothetical protein n=1 Tax=Salmonella enterica TaxID=28901 RepID=UPI00329872F9